MSLVERARRFKEQHAEAPDRSEFMNTSETLRTLRTESQAEMIEPSAVSVRNERSVFPQSQSGAGAYADQLIARLAVDTAVVRVIDGELAIRDSDEVSPIILQLIDAYKPDVLRIVGEMERAREYGRIYRREITKDT